MTQDRLFAEIGRIVPPAQLTNPGQFDILQSVHGDDFAIIQPKPSQYCLIAFSGKHSRKGT